MHAQGGREDLQSSAQRSSLQAPRMRGLINPVYLHFPTLLSFTSRLLLSESRRYKALCLELPSCFQIAKSLCLDHAGVPQRFKAWNAHAQ